MESNVMNKVWEACDVLLQWEVDEFLQWEVDESGGVAGTTNKPEAKSASEALFEARMLLQEALRNLRNCDVGTAEEQEKRFETFCSLYHLPKGKGCYSCPAIPTRSPNAFQRNACKINWLQMPYEPDMKKEERNDAE